MDLAVIVQSVIPCYSSRKSGLSRIHCRSFVAPLPDQYSYVHCSTAKTNAPHLAKVSGCALSLSNYRTPFQVPPSITCKYANNQLTVVAYRHSLQSPMVTNGLEQPSSSVELRRLEQEKDYDLCTDRRTRLMRVERKLGMCPRCLPPTLGCSKQSTVGMLCRSNQEALRLSTCGRIDRGSP